MQFTPQQLTGGPKYHHATRIGNWSEDQELQEIAMKNFLSLKESGQLKVTAKQQQLEECLRSEELSSSPDGNLCFGQKVMLFSHETKGFLSVNPYDAQQKYGQTAFMATTSPNRSDPCVRNTFIIERVNLEDGEEDDAVHYGQVIRLRMLGFGTQMVEDTYLHSEMVTSLAAAKFSRHQEVTMLSQSPSGETKWQLLFPDVNQMLEMEGQLVPAGSPIVLRHVQTGSYLASMDIPYDNIFGRECEVHCFDYRSLNKTQNLTSEKRGDITGDVALRKLGLPNVWMVRTATSD